MPSSILSFKSINPQLELPDSHRRRKYELLSFPSGLRCLLISDSSSHMVAASMTVGCGSFEDPDEIHGMAHLCEHLVVLGSSQSRLRQVVSGSGGSINACTGSDQTSFAFEVSSHVEDKENPKSFIMDAMLPVFASYFLKLRVTTASIRAEARAIHEEHMLNIANVEKILWHGIRLLANVRHPFSRFSTGNLATFSRAPGKLLRASLASYHAHNFRPENMALVIKGPQSVNHLRKIAVNNFTSDNVALHGGLQRFKSRQAELFDFLTNNIIFIKSQDKRRIRLCYPFSSAEKLSYSAQTTLCNIIGNESTNSLCYQLKKIAHLAETVIVQTQEICKDNSLFIIDIETTHQGMRQVLNVLHMVFSFLERTLPELPDQDMQCLIDEYRIVDRLQFKRKKVPTSLLDEVVGYSEYIQSHTEDIHGIVRGMADPAPINSSRFKEVFGKILRRDRLFLQILDSNCVTLHNFGAPIPAFTRDEYFGFEYIRLRYDFSFLHGRVCFDFSVSQPIGDLAPNVIFLLDEGSKKPSIKHRGLKLNSELPMLRTGDETLQIWTHEATDKDDLEFSVHVKFDLIAVDAPSLVGIEIMASLVGEKLQFMLYNIESLGCSWSLHVNVHGVPSLMLSASGPTTLAHYALETMMKEVAICLELMERCVYLDLKRARVLLRRTYEQYMSGSGVKLVFVTGSMLFDEGLISPAERIKALELIEVNDVAALGKCMLLAQTFTSALVSGNNAEAQLPRLTELCRLMCGTGALGKRTHPESSFLLPRGKCCTLEVIGPPGDHSAVVYYYVQMGERSSLTTYAMAKLAELVISASAFEDLRMKRRLAYGIFTGMRMFKKTFGIHVTVSTVSHSCGFVIDQIEQFLEELSHAVDSFSEEQFAKLVQDLDASADELAGDEAASSNLFSSLQPVNGSSDQHLTNGHTVHWNNLEQILNKTYNFGGRACEERIDIAILETITLEEFRNFFRLTVCFSSPSSSVVAICKEAVELEREQKLKIVCKLVHDRLQENNLYLSEEIVFKAVKKCNDLETLQDLNLESYFTGLGQAMRYQKFKVKLRVGGLLKKLGTKHISIARHHSGAHRQIYTSIHEVQSLCWLVH